MTAGYRAGGGMPGQGADERADATLPIGPGGDFANPPAVPGAVGHAAGAQSTAFPSQPAGAPAQFGGEPGQPAGSVGRTSWPPAANSGQWGGPTGASAVSHVQGGWPPAQPGGPAIAPGGPAAATGAPTVSPGGPTVAPGGPAAAPGGPVIGAPYPGQPSAGPGYPGQPGPAAAYSDEPANGSGRRRWLPVLALVLAGVLAVVAGVQAYQIHRLNGRLAATDRRLAEAQGADGLRLDGLEKRAEALEKQAGAAFNPEAVAGAVLPSVLRVKAGDFTGTAFAIGKPPAGGGTTLLTNFHVVESVYAGGGRKVFLERTDQRFAATIVKVDKDKDLAQLLTTARFTGLVAATEAVRSGQQIVVVGAPLGLQDSVTTGVVSAFREDKDGSGPVIQFDAPINPGNSGGPVINGSKEVVGIATAKARDAEGIGLAVPIKTACDTFKLC